MTPEEIKERLAAREASKGPRTGGLKPSPGRKVENQINGILNRLDALELEVQGVAAYAADLRRMVEQLDASVTQMEEWRLRQAPAVRERLEREE